MNDIERRLRAALNAAAVQWTTEHQLGRQPSQPPGRRRSGWLSPGRLLSGERWSGDPSPGSGSAEHWLTRLQAGIRRRHRWHVRRVAAGWVAATAAVLLAVPPVTHALQSRQVPAGHSPHGQAVAPATSSPTDSPAAAAGTTLLGCADDVYGQLPGNWRSGSLEVGPLWFANDRPHGYVHYSGANAGTGFANTSGKLRVGVMIIEVRYGATVVMKVARTARSYFRFLPGFYQTSGYTLSDGVSGLTLASCPRGTPAGDNGLVTDFYLGFLIKSGSQAPVYVRTSASASPIGVTFTCVVLGCGT